MPPFAPVRRPLFLLLLSFILPVTSMHAAQHRAREKWVASWASSPQGPYPSGFAVAQPDLSFAFPVALNGASDQTFRLAVKPDLWGKQVRLQFSNVFGTKPVTFDNVYIGLQASGAALVPGTNRQVSFLRGKLHVTIPAGESIYSDAVQLNHVTDARAFAGRRLCVSFHVAGSSGPMTWHAKALTTSYLSPPNSGALAHQETDESFPFTTTSWFFLTGVEVMAPADTLVVAAFGDSITDGTGSTMNGDDRWPDFLSRRLHAVYGDHVSVVNAGIGGNQVIGPAAYSTENPFGGGPSALQRLDRDLVGLAGLTAVVWMEGINDLGMSETSEGAPAVNAGQVIDGFRRGVERLHTRHIKVIGATLPSSFKSLTGIYGSTKVDAERRAINSFIRTTNIFNSVADFDAASLDVSTGTLRASFQPNSTIGGTGDLIHPNRAGYQAMANTIDLTAFASAERAATGK